MTIFCGPAYSVNHAEDSLYVLMYDFRFKEFLKRTPPSNKPPVPAVRGAAHKLPGDDVEYYNDLPGKRPPPIPTTTSHPPVSESINRPHKG